MQELIDLRHKLHYLAEVSGEEKKTSELIKRQLEKTKPDKIITALGGEGLAAVFDSGKPGPRVLIRCELDALPIPEFISLEYGSKNDGKAHKCGHDGHMAIVSGLAGRMRGRMPTEGSVVLLFQPAEEIGKGAWWVITDPKFKEIEPDYAFALHNLPGFLKNQIIIRDGFFASASVGLIVKLHGATSHAAEPESGRSPALAVAQMIQNLSSLMQFHARLHEAVKVTIIHAKIGERAFGTTPGEGVVMATLRTHDQAVMEKLKKKSEQLAESIARTYDLDFEVEWDEEFPSTENDKECVDLIRECASELNLDIHEPAVPFPWSEDFGHFPAKYKGALFGLGAGEKHPVLHHPTYDFPDDILKTGIDMFERIIRKLSG